MQEDLSRWTAETIVFMHSRGARGEGGGVGCGGTRCMRPLIKHMQHGVESDPRDNRNASKRTVAHRSC